MPKHSSSASMSSALSATENYEPPEVIDFAALRSKDKLVRSREVEFTSRDSTPFMMDIPPGLDDWRSDAPAARRTVEKFFGKPAAGEIRQSICYAHYWKTEATLRRLLNMVTGKLSDQFDGLRTATTDNIRDLISDRQYWETEAMHYKRYLSNTLGVCGGTGTEAQYGV